MLPACLMAERPSSSFFDEQIITQSREKFSFDFSKKDKTSRLAHWSKDTIYTKLTLMP